MDNYFEKYLDAKFTIATLVIQLYKYKLSIIDAIQINYKYDEKDKDGEFVNCLFHQFDSDGEKAFNILNINSNITSPENLYNIRSNIKNEKYNKKINYKRKYLEMTLLIINITKYYYLKRINNKDAKQLNINYHDIDTEDILIYHHEYESAGEKAWSFLGIEDNYITIDTFDSIKDNCIKELIKQKD